MLPPACDSNPLEHYSIVWIPENEQTQHYNAS